MAANDYYYDSTDHQRRRLDAPLPPAPNPYSSYNTNPQQYKTSTISSPFDDPSYRPHGRQSSQSLASTNAYPGAGGGHNYDPSPYSDDIPLRTQQRKSSSDLLNPNHRSDAELARPPIGPRKKSRTGATRRKRKKGLWSGRIPFVVYFSPPYRQSSSLLSSSKQVFDTRSSRATLVLIVSRRRDAFSN